MASHLQVIARWFTWLYRFAASSGGERRLFAGIERHGFVMM